MNWISEHLVEVLGIVSMVIATCAAIAALTPTPKDDLALRKVRRVIDFIGMNFLHASNSRIGPTFRR